jgi:hypothetical protein
MKGRDVVACTITFFFAVMFLTVGVGYRPPNLFWFMGGVAASAFWLAISLAELVSAIRPGPREE